jgi:hypothetical protein
VSRRSCDQLAPFDPNPQPKRSEPATAQPETREVETVELVFGPRGRFAGFKRSISVEVVK